MNARYASPARLAAAALSIGFLWSPNAKADESETHSWPACDRVPSDSDVTAAKGAFEAGQVSFQEADYERSILYWEDAFRRDCTAAPLLLNLGRAYELSGQKEQAVIALQTYLERRPDAPDRSSIEKRIENLRAQQKTKREPAPETSKDPTPAAATSTSSKAPPEEPAQRSKEEKSSPKPLWPVILTGSGLVVLGVGLPTAIVGQNDVNHYKELCPPQMVNGEELLVCPTGSNYQSEAEKAQNVRNFGVGLTIFGAAASITGGVLWAIFWNRSPEAAPTALVPAIGPDYQGISWSGRF